MMKRLGIKLRGSASLVCATLALVAGIAASPRVSSANNTASVSSARYSHITMEGASMEPSLHNGQVLRIDRQAYTHRAPRRGDIVVFKGFIAGATFHYLLKRVIGLPGERVDVHRHGVFINGHRLSEPYVCVPAMYFFLPRRVPRAAYFVLGDNRNNSEDSHLFGSVPARDIVARVIVPRTK